MKNCCNNLDREGRFPYHSERMNISAFDYRQYFNFLKSCLVNVPNTEYSNHKAQTVWTIVGLFIYPFLTCICWLFFFIDDVFRPSVKKQKVERPLFIIGNFRSGTTFLQRLLCMDVPNFSGGTSWELVLAPSFTARQLVKGINIVDKWIGRPLRRIVALIEKRYFSQDTTHKTNMRTHEEDEIFFIHCFTSFFMTFADPVPEPYNVYYKFETLVPPHKKAKAMAYFEGCIKRHMRFHRGSRHYLSKSPTFTARCISLRKKFPDARFVYLVRNPLDMLPSLMDRFSQVWVLLQKEGTRFPYKDTLVDFVHHWYVDGLETLKDFSDEQVKIVEYDSLITNPINTIEAIYSWMGIPISDQFHEILIRERDLAKRSWKPRQHNLSIDGFDPQQIERELETIFKRFSYSTGKDALNGTSKQYY